MNAYICESKIVMPEITFSSARTPLLVLADGVRAGTISPGTTGLPGNIRRARGLYVLRLNGIQWTPQGKPTRRSGIMGKRFTRLCDAQEAAVNALRAKWLAESRQNRKEN